jgi:hypothetical protein
VGNHEAYDPQAAGYWDYFYGPGVTKGRLGDRPYGWYTAAIGSWRFISLNSECDAGGLAGGCGVGSPQYEWLRSVLASDTATCTVVAFHKPRWSTGAAHSEYVPMAPMWDLMASYGVDIALSGHNHDVEVFKPIGASGSSTQPTLSATGIRQFVDGAGGDSLYTFNALSTAPGSAVVARSNNTFGPLKLVLKPGSYDWSFQPIAGTSFVNSGTTGSFSGSDTCH